METQEQYCVDFLLSSITWRCQEQVFVNDPVSKDTESVGS
jgi:hypothetical protein